jgi:hypothetical protein
MTMTDINTRDRDLMKTLMGMAISQLESRPHPTLPGLRERYYDYRGSFTLLEHLTPKAIARNVARLRRKGEHEHAAALDAWSTAP